MSNKCITAEFFKDINEIYKIRQLPLELLVNRVDDSEELEKLISKSSLLDILDTSPSKFEKSNLFDKTGFEPFDYIYIDIDIEQELVTQIVILLNKNDNLYLDNINYCMLNNVKFKTIDFSEVSTCYTSSTAKMFECSEIDNLYFPNFNNISSIIFMFANSKIKKLYLPLEFELINNHVFDNANIDLLITPNHDLINRLKNAKNHNIKKYINQELDFTQFIKL